VYSIDGVTMNISQIAKVPLSNSRVRVTSIPYVMPKVVITSSEASSHIVSPEISRFVLGHFLVKVSLIISVKSYMVLISSKVLHFWHLLR